VIYYKDKIDGGCVSKLEIKQNNIRWIDLQTPTSEEIQELDREFDFHPLDLHELVTPTHRSRLDRYADHLFMVMIYPAFDRQKREFDPVELQIFFGKDYLVTVHNGGLEPFNQIVHFARQNTRMRNLLFSAPEHLLYQILSRLQDTKFPILEQIDNEIDHVEKSIFSGKEKAMVREISIIRRNITDLRKILKSHQKVYEKIVEAGKNPKDLYIKEQDYFDNLSDHSKEIWEMLENAKEQIEALHGTNESLISFRINDVMSVLTAISVILLPMGIFSQLFGVNAAHIPFVGAPMDFWIIVGLTVGLGFLTFTILKLKRFL
jgi:magnesium transporter